jgi:hypothetical protein
MKMKYWMMGLWLLCGLGVADVGVKLKRSGIVKDDSTSLVWMRCSLGQQWTGATCSGEAKKYTFEGAKQATQTLNAKGGYAGFADWRVPTIEELYSLVWCSDGSKKGEARDGWLHTGCGDKYFKGNYVIPTINQRLFPNTPIWYYCSSSKYARDSSQIWEVLFSYGGTTDTYHYSDCSVRLVRSGQ